jgi:hypothetical protein
MHKPSARSGEAGLKCAGNGLVGFELVDRTADAIEDFVWLPEAIDPLMKLALTVKVNQRRSFRFIDFQSLSDRFWSVVAPSFFLATLDEASDEFVFRDLDLDNAREAVPLIGKVTFQRFGLCHGPREPVEQTAAATIGLGKTVGHQIDNDLIGHEFAAIHIVTELLAQFGLISYRSANDVSGGDVGQIIRLGNASALCTFADSRRSEKHDEHAYQRFVSGCHGIDNRYPFACSRPL